MKGHFAEIVINNSTIYAFPFAHTEGPLVYDLPIRVIPLSDILDFGSILLDLLEKARVGISSNDPSLPGAKPIVMRTHSKSWNDMAKNGIIISASLNDSLLQLHLNEYLGSKGTSKGLRVVEESQIEIDITESAANERIAAAIEKIIIGHHIVT